MTSRPPISRISPRASALFRAEEGDAVSERNDKPPPPPNDSEPGGTTTNPNDPAFFNLTPTPFDIRTHFRSIFLILFLSPLVLDYLSFRLCAIFLAASYAVPAIIRLRYHHFMEVNIIDDLRIEAGACLSILGSTTALLLETHHSSISLAVKSHPEFYNRPLTRLLRTYLFVELAFNGTSEEKEQTASWLHWTHRHIHGAITEDVRRELGIPDDVTNYGYIDDLKAWVMYTLTWSTIAFQARFGRPLSKRALDTIVLENTCAALRIGVPEDLLAKDYATFLTLFNRKLAMLGTGNPLTHSIVESVEKASTSADMHWLTKIWIRSALMIGHELLPPRVRDAYQLEILSKWWQRALQKSMLGVLWFVYPALMWLPLRGVISLLLVLEPQLRPVFVTSLRAIHSMDILSDKPLYPTNTSLTPEKGPHDADDGDIPSYIQWLDSGKDGRPFLQCVMVCILKAQLSSSQAASTSRWSLRRLTPWITLPGHLAILTIHTIWRYTLDTLSSWHTQINESIIFHKPTEVKVPQHIGFVMDGNRRYARRLGKPVIVGHQHGAQTASNILEWWLRFMPNTSRFTPTTSSPPHHASNSTIKHLTVWAFSSDNLKRSPEEVTALFHLMSAEFKTLALTSIVHLFRIRVRVIGRLDGLPQELLAAIAFLEETTRMHSQLFLQVAVGYGGRDEIVRSVHGIVSRGEEVTEESISRGTFCAQVGVPPVDLIVRTSEHRTSGFFLWDTQSAELYFIDKLWPQLTEGDWLNAVASFSTREIRGGK